MKNRLRKVLIITSFLVSLMAIVLYYSGVLMFDAGGLSKAQVQAMPIKKQYGLLIDRFDELETILTGLRPIIDESFGGQELEWETMDIGIVGSGAYGYDARPGSSNYGSYYVSSTRIILHPHITGGRWALNGLGAYFEEQGWQYNISSSEIMFVRHTATARTKDGWYIRVRVLNEDFSEITVTSGNYWGERLKLQEMRLKEMQLI